MIVRELPPDKEPAQPAAQQVSNSSHQKQDDNSDCTRHTEKHEGREASQDSDATKQKKRYSTWRPNHAGQRRPPCHRDGVIVSSVSNERSLKEHHAKRKGMGGHANYKERDNSDGRAKHIQSGLRRLPPDKNGAEDCA